MVGVVVLVCCIDLSLFVLCKYFAQSMCEVDGGLVVVIWDLVSGRLAILLIRPEIVLFDWGELPSNSPSVLKVTIYHILS